MTTGGLWPATGMTALVVIMVGKRRLSALQFFPYFCQRRSHCLQASFAKPWLHRLFPFLLGTAHRSPILVTLGLVTVSLLNQYCWSVS